VIHAHGEPSTPICNEEYKRRRKIPAKHKQPPNNEIAQKQRGKIPSSINQWTMPCTSFVAIRFVVAIVTTKLQSQSVFFAVLLLVWSLEQTSMVLILTRVIFFRFWPCLPRQGYCV
jgi:hypothetical protein